jgi:predicted Rossmann fold flavoprotein
METKIEAAQRVFPKSDKAQSVFDVLVREMKSTGVVVQSSVTVEKILTDKDTVTGIQIKGGKILTAKKYIIATGGKSHPETGSTGDGFTWLQDIGHTVIDTSSALVPLALKESHISKLAGISLSDIKITVLQNDKRHDTQKGKILFTHVGVTGPTILNMSKDIGELLAYGQVFLSLDLFPTLDHKELDGRIMRYMFENSNKKFKNSFTELLPQALLTTLIDIVEIDGEMQCNGLPKYKRQAFVHLLKDIRYEVKGLLGTDKAVVTSGGVDLKEVDFKTMQSRIFQNLYIIGDMLHIDRPSGGFSLQLCWTTGVVAGMSAAREE